MMLLRKVLASIIKQNVLTAAWQRSMDQVAQINRFYVRCAMDGSGVLYIHDI